MQFYPYEIPAAVGTILFFFVWSAIGLGLSIRETAKGKDGNGDIHLGIIFAVGLGLLMASLQSWGRKGWGGQELRLFGEGLYSTWLDPNIWYAVVVQLSYSNIGMWAGAGLVVAAILVKLYDFWARKQQEPILG